MTANCDHGHDRDDLTECPCCFEQVACAESHVCLPIGWTQATASLPEPLDLSLAELDDFLRVIRGDDA